MKIMSLMRNRRFLPGFFRGHVPDKRGFTIVELLVSMAIVAIISAALYGIYNNFSKRVNVQDQIQETLQNARAGITFMEREFMNAGLATADAEALRLALVDEIEFVYTDPEDTLSGLSATAGLRIKVHYGLETLSGVQYLYRSMALCVGDPACDTALGSNEPIISHVSGLTITYFDSIGDFLTPTTEEIREDVRFATIELSATTKEILPGETALKEFTVKTHLRIRNLGIGTTATDSVNPDPATEVQVRDSGECSSLLVKWRASASSDVKKYTISYGTASGMYNNVINIPLSSLSGSTYSCAKTVVLGIDYYECKITPVSIPLVHSPSHGTGDTMYYVMVMTYDFSDNYSVPSNEASGNPAISQLTFAGGTTDDSTINPVKPGAVWNFIGSDGAGDNQVSFAWDTYNTSSNPGVTGMRLYRSTSPITTYPIVADGTVIKWIAGEPGTGRFGGEISPGDTSYTDRSLELLGCQLYYYAIAPVNCDTSLIADDDASEDGDNTKYLVSNYTFTNGDGASGAATDTPSGADTSPAETTAPPAPTFGVRAGWKRVNVSFRQPNVADIARSCVYVNEGATYPELQTDTALYPLTDGCLQINTSLTPQARLIPDFDGIFSNPPFGRNVPIAVYHDSMTLAEPVAPELAEDGTFSYREVSVDLCGNTSGINEAQAVTILCGEDPPVVDFTANSTNHPKPPAVTLPSVSSCASTSSFDWTPVSSNPGAASTPTNPYDLAGYRIARSTTSDFSSGNTLLTSGLPYWGSSYSDSALVDGTAYYYRIISTDCVYEADDPSDDAVISDAADNTLHSIDLPVVYPGRILRDKKCEVVDSCTPDDHREVLTGVDMDNALGNGDNTSTPQSSYYHDKVTIFFENTSGSTLTIQQISINWGNTEAFLSNVKIGGGRGGLGEISTAIDIADTQSIAIFPDQTRAVIDKDITDVQIPAGAHYVPIELTFTDADGNSVDMRDDKLLIELDIQNDSTLTTTCISNLTISEVLENIVVPFGPSISATQQDRPTSPTFSYPVPGPAGLNTVPSGANASLLVVGNIPIKISALVKSNTTDGVGGGKIGLNLPVLLHYIATARTVTVAPASGYTAVNMTDTGGGIYTAAIPMNDGLRIWYYIFVIDADGNFDRDPEIDSGAYSYDQDTYVFDVCDLTTDAPTGLSSTENGSDPGIEVYVDLEWTAPTEYTDGSPIDTGLDPLTYVIYRDGDPTPIAYITDPTLVYTDTVADAGAIFSYQVSVQNSCAAPKPTESAKSNTSSICIGASLLGTMSVDKTSIIVGESFTVTITDCKAFSTPYDVLPLDVLNVGDFKTFSVASAWSELIKPAGILETSAASGQFVITINTTDDVDVSLPTPLIHTLTTGANDITVSYTWAGNSPITIDVNSDPCDSTPSAPTGLTGGVSSNHQSIDNLTWNAVTTNDDASVISDLAGYYVYWKVCAKNKPDCTGADIDTDWIHVYSAGPADTSITKPILAAHGNTNQREYYFRVTAYDTCGTPNESAYSSEWFETD